MMSPRPVHHLQCALSLSFWLLLQTAVVSVDGVTVLYVDDDAATGGDGAAWGTAFDALQPALDTARLMGPPVEIRVGQGRYLPEALTDPGEPRSATFALMDGLTLRGGYAGVGASDPERRDPAAYPTVLSGDLAGDDVEPFLNTDENAYNVLSGLAAGETVTLDGLIVVGGHAFAPGPTSGAAVRCGGNLDVLDCVFEADEAHYDGIVHVDGNLTARNCRWSHNRYSLVTVAESERVFLEGCLFEDNADSAAVETGSAIVAVEGCRFEGNGRIAWLRGSRSTVSLRNSSFVNNTGGLGVEFAASTTLENCVFEQNPTRFGIATLATTHLDMRRCLFLGNTTRDQYPMIDLQAADLSIQDCSFVSNSGATDGTVRISASITEIVDVLFQGNQANRDGGAVHSLRGSLSLQECTFLNNSAVRGGGVWATGDSIRIADCLFAANTAADGAGGGRGGGCYFDDPATLERCDFIGNLSDRGGGVYGETYGFEFAACTFIGNEALRGGGIMTLNGLTAADCTFRANTATGVTGHTGGGAVSISDGHLTISDSSFFANHSAASGGAIQDGAGESTLIGCELDLNTADLDGGAIFGNTTTPIRQCTFRNNYAARDGGAIQSGGAEIEDAVFTSNRAGRDGGAVAGDVRLVNSLLIQNRAVRRGGAASATNYGNLTNCVVVRNAAEGPDGQAGGVFGEILTSITNTILWENADRRGITEFAQIDGDPQPRPIDNNCIQHLNVYAIPRYDSRLRNIAGPPGFVDIDGGDFHLLPDSPCIDAGGPPWTSPLALLDFDGEPRVMGCEVDIGVDEVPWTAGEPRSGDMNADGVVDAADVPLFVQALLNPMATESCVGDASGDRGFNGRDIQPFVNALTQP